MMVDEPQEKLERKRTKQLQSAERQRKIQRDDFVKAALTTAQGRAYIWWIMEIAKTHYQPFTGNALTTSFNCGEMNIGKQILAHVLEVAPKGYLDMLAEKQEEALKDDRSKPDAEPDSDTDA